MTTLKAIREKYQLGDGAKYEPNPNCKFCKGTGEKTIKRGRFAGEPSFCICLFTEPEFSNELGSMLGGWAKKQLDEMETRFDDEST